MSLRIARGMGIVVMLAMLAACGSSGDPDEQTGEGDPVEPSQTAEEMYNEARDLLDKHRYGSAVDAFEEIEREYPYSEWSVKAKIMAAYTSYEQREYDKALAILERYIALHPGSASIAYAYYLKALCYYERITDVGRDQRITEQAQTALEDIIRRFPGTDYAQDARLKLDLVRDHLAGKEMEVGRFYLKRHEYLAAINRFRYVVEAYDTTSHAPEALYRLVEAYLALGITDEATKEAAVLGYNYPDDPWYKRAYALLRPGTDGTPPQAESESSLWQKLKDAL